MPGWGWWKVSPGDYQSAQDSESEQGMLDHHLTDIHLLFLTVGNCTHKKLKAYVEENSLRFHHHHHPCPAKAKETRRKQANEHLEVWGSKKARDGFHKQVKTQLWCSVLYLCPPKRSERREWHKDYHDSQEKDLSILRNLTYIKCIVWIVMRTKCNIF